ncbi:hypothetical protein V7x_10530 [Crateriforma conspicua]|uniref:Uncharacterized protein n=1 Tax=Crateriforma conspicua TaxID=2527996 RepID=A0A5C6FT63_9PLAN|nr:hypothetical protein V7x_10530 [Crateriforma conspicua]
MTASITDRSLQHHSSSGRLDSRSHKAFRLSPSRQRTSDELTLPRWRLLTYPFCQLLPALQAVRMTRVEDERSGWHQHQTSRPCGTISLGRTRTWLGRMRHCQKTARSTNVTPTSFAASYSTACVAVLTPALHVHLKLLRLLRSDQLPAFPRATADCWPTEATGLESPTFGQTPTARLGTPTFNSHLNQKELSPPA